MASDFHLRQLCTDRETLGKTAELVVRAVNLEQHVDKPPDKVLPILCLHIACLMLGHRLVTRQHAQRAADDAFDIKAHVFERYINFLEPRLRDGKRKRGIPQPGPSRSASCTTQQSSRKRPPSYNELIATHQLPMPPSWLLPCFEVAEEAFLKSNLFSTEHSVSSVRLAVFWYVCRILKISLIKGKDMFPSTDFCVANQQSPQDFAAALELVRSTVRPIKKRIRAHVETKRDPSKKNAFSALLPLRREHEHETRTMFNIPFSNTLICHGVEDDAVLLTCPGCTSSSDQTPADRLYFHGNVHGSRSLKYLILSCSAMDEYHLYRLPATPFHIAEVFAPCHTDASDHKAPSSSKRIVIAPGNGVRLWTDSGSPPQSVPGYSSKRVGGATSPLSSVIITTVGRGFSPTTGIAKGEWQSYQPSFSRLQQFILTRYNDQVPAGFAASPEVPSVTSRTAQPLGPFGTHDLSYLIDNTSFPPPPVQKYTPLETLNRTWTAHAALCGAPSVRIDSPSGDHPYIPGVGAQGFVYCERVYFGRPVQITSEDIRPRPVPVEIYWAGKEKGWGVRCCAPIKKGSVVGLYTGTLLKRSEIEGEKDAMYLFDLDFDDSDDEDESSESSDVESVGIMEGQRKRIRLLDGGGRGGKRDTDREKYTVDATKQGNWTRFLNHSCSPNLGIVEKTYGSNDNPENSYIAFVATSHIRAKSELTFDYTGSRIEADDLSSPVSDFDSVPEEKRCRCGSSQCRGQVGPLYDAKRIRSAVMGAARGTGSKDDPCVLDEDESPNGKRTGGEMEVLREEERENVDEDSDSVNIDWEELYEKLRKDDERLDKGRGKGRRADEDGIGGWERMDKEINEGAVTKEKGKEKEKENKVDGFGFLEVVEDGKTVLVFDDDEDELDLIGPSSSIAMASTRKRQHQERERREVSELSNNFAQTLSQPSMGGSHPIEEDCGMDGDDWFPRGSITCTASTSASFGPRSARKSTGRSTKAKRYLEKERKSDVDELPRLSTVLKAKKTVTTVLDVIEISSDED